jgi:hypothetical protein
MGRYSREQFTGTPIYALRDTSQPILPVNLACLALVMNADNVTGSMAACAFAALRGARRGRLAACLAVYRARQPLACGCGWRDLPGGMRARYGDGAGGWARVKSGFIFPILPILFLYLLTCYVVYSLTSLALQFLAL